ncbi:hypothetical protein CFC21_032165 [Triticum aestivum]|uniref:Glycosyltransferase n=2 Tax=Triticum aestivum TaxID=4565 RepID=A0A9R1EZ94_WHEAT|nr:hypothetical protein CFC21_032160 [Triticum aestivum]KAF7018931.1 hypothetical protein CFC21_032165 [Triticum aestivum]
MADAARAVHPPCHVVALPYPGRGHVNAMLSLCRLLAARGVATTVILTEEWVGLVGAAEPPLPELVNLTAIPNVIPSEHGRAADLPGFADAVNTRMEAPVERLLEEMLPTPDMAVVVVVADFLLRWAVPMALRRGVKACTFCPFSATNFAALYHFERLMAGSSLAVDDPMWDQPIPGHTCLTMREFQPILCGEASRGRFMAGVRSARAGQCVLFSSFYELEAGVMDSLVSEEPSSPRMYSIGPCIPYTTLEEAPRGEHSYWAWLDTQPAGSVLYVSLGSFHSLPPSQLAELDMGLVTSRVKFLWALHDQAQSQVRPLLGGNGDGVLVSWCDQLKVPCHPSVGGFLTHCGMNSVLEAVFAGVPMLTLPIYRYGPAYHQPPDRRRVEDWVQP